jgi:hypothetical protein
MPYSGTFVPKFSHGAVEGPDRRTNPAPCACTARVGHRLR